MYPTITFSFIRYAQNLILEAKLKQTTKYFIKFLLYNNNRYNENMCNVHPISNSKKTFFGPKTEQKKSLFRINNKQYERSLSDVIDIRMHFILRTIHFSNNFFDSILIAKFGILLFFQM